MQVGLHTLVKPVGGEPHGPPPEADNVCIGVIVSRTFPEEQLVEETLRRGAENNPGAFWYIKERDSFTRGIMDRLGIEYVEIPTIKGFGAQKVLMRDLTLQHCDILLVFQKTGASSRWSDLIKRRRQFNALIGRDPEYRAKPGRGLFVIERGKAKAKARKARKPVGA